MHDSLPAAEHDPSNARARQSGDATASTVAEHSAVRAVVDALRARGQQPAVRVLDEAVHTAALAAAALGIEVAQIANSLVFDADGSPVLVMTSGGHRVDTGKVAALLGASKVRRASADFVKTHTGQSIGGVAPVGHPAEIRTLVDDWLARYDEIWAAAGHARTVYPTTYDELLSATGGTPADVGE